jgi:hypothetical protein
MAKKIFLVVFTIECVVLAILLCREWTLHYIGGGQSAADYETVYRDKIEAGHHPVTAEIDAGTTSFVFWWGGTICIFLGVSLGGPAWAYQQLWPDREVRAAVAIPPPWEAVEQWDDDDEDRDAADEDELFGDDYEGARAM